MEYLFYAPDIIANPTLPEEESLHCVRVLRLMEGDHIILTDGKGFLYSAVLLEAHPKRCLCNITEKKQQDLSWNFNLHIAVAPTKNMERMEWFVEKATEIGVNHITFLRCQHSERREIKLQRLTKIAVSALKQSQQATLPDIHEMTDFYDFIRYPFDGQKMFGSCEEEKKELLKDRYQSGRNLLFLIGPEGDFSRKEINDAIAADFLPVSLGPNRLRTETAALVACHTFHLINIMQ
jgi:16S rRNA (uracil1498-N3)-methyltransferase